MSADAAPTLTQAAITTIRTLAIDGVQAANSGHPGMPMGCAPMAYLLFGEVMRHDPAQPDWPGRDRFVLSAGHGSMLLYASLHLTGYDAPTLDDLRNFRQWGSPTAGHPESFELAGVETTTGPLGQGFANGVGMALAAERLAAEFGDEVVPQRVYGIVSDGDLMEGVASEAASLAGHLQLGRVTYLYDDNQITIDGRTDKAFSEDVLARFDAYGWHTLQVDDGNDLEALRAAIAAADADERPSLIKVRTVIGYGSPAKADSSGVHGSPLGDEEVAATKAAYGWDHPPFHVPDEVRAHLDARERGAAHREEWERALAALAARDAELAAAFDRRVVRGALPEGWRDALPGLESGDATRKHSGAVINALAPVLPELFGGSADLAASNNTDVDGGGDFSAPGARSVDARGRDGRNLRLGIREHAMASMANGMALHGGLIPYVATFLVFTDYCRPAIRLSALMRQRVIYVMTHDSIGLGEDGPTHQPVEHLMALRAIPGLQVLRPADGTETVAAWEAALTYDGPSVIALTRQGLPWLGERPADGPTRGGYVVADLGVDDGGSPEVALIATGSEVSLAVAAAERLAELGTAVRVVSLPSWERFAAQDPTYRASVLPDTLTARVAIEAGITFGWERHVGAHGEVVGLDRFGASAPAPRLFEEFGFTPQAVVAAAQRAIARAER
ncbi:MAG: transketolase [Nitriliruptoraceae bacterium]|nr:transketolase [Nitriliruptoraceae bacterium]